MLVHYDKSEEAAKMREAKLKAEFENKGHFTAGKIEGKQEGLTEGLENAVKTMYKNGFDEETIARALSLDLEYVKGVLSK